MAGMGSRAPRRSAMAAGAVGSSGDAMAVANGSIAPGPNRIVSLEYAWTTPRLPAVPRPRDRGRRRLCPHAARNQPDRRFPLACGAPYTLMLGRGNDAASARYIGARNVAPPACTIACMRRIASRAPRAPFRAAPFQRPPTGCSRSERSIPRDAAYTASGRIRRCGLRCISRAAAIRDSRRCRCHGPVRCRVPRQRTPGRVRTPPACVAVACL